MTMMGAYDLSEHLSQLIKQLKRGRESARAGGQTIYDAMVVLKGIYHSTTNRNFQQRNKIMGFTSNQNQDLVGIQFVLPPIPQRSKYRGNHSREGCLHRRSEKHLQCTPPLPIHLQTEEHHEAIYSF